MKEPCFPAEGGGCWVCMMEGSECGEPEAYQEIEDLAVIVIRDGTPNPSAEDIEKAALRKSGKGSYSHRVAVQFPKNIRAAYDRIQRTVGGQQSLF